MERLETSTTQVNAALLYCQENKVNIFGPVRNISRAFIGSMTFKPREALSIKIVANMKSQAKQVQSLKEKSFSWFLRNALFIKTFLSRVA